MQRTIKLAMDITFLQDQYASRGIGRYGSEILVRLIELAQQEEALVPNLHLIGFGTLEDNLKLLNIAPTELKHVTFYSLGAAKASSPLANIRLYLTKIRPIIKKLRPDIYYAVHFDRGLPSNIVPTVVTIHDVIPLVTGKFSTKGPLVNYFKGLFYRMMWLKVQQAKLIFTSSNFSKTDLIKYGKLPEDKIQVVYLGIADYFNRANITTNQKEIDAVLGKLDLLDEKSDTVPYMIYDSGLEANKNIGSLLKIFSKLAQREDNLKLVLTGGDFERHEAGFKALNERSLKVLGYADKLQILDRIVPTGRISEKDLLILLSEARQYINMSGYEGFGFGPLQAMAAGVPVIISNKGSFPEISGAAAIVVDPTDPDKAAAHIIESLSNDSAIKEMVKLGYTQAAKYNWHNTFQEVWQGITKLWINLTAK